MKFTASFPAGANRAPVNSLGASASGAFSLHEARDEYEKVQRAYDRAVTLTQTQRISEIWPALVEAKRRLLAAEVLHGF